MAYFDKYGVEFSDDRRVLVKCPPTLSGTYVIPEGVVMIEEDAFMCCEEITSIIVPEGVKRISDGAFQLCESLVSVSLPKSIDRIRWSTFNGCKKLSSINLPEGIDCIEGNAFSCCHGLKTIKIPRSVRRIEENAIYECLGLETVDIPASVWHIGINFHNCDNLVSINMEENDGHYCSCDGVLYWRTDTFANLMKCPARKQGSYVVSRGTWGIEMYAFGNCKGLTSISLPDTIARIDETAFFGCTNLREIVVPSRVMGRISKLDGLKPLMNKVVVR